MTTRRIAAGIALLVAAGAIALARHQPQRACEPPPRDCVGAASYCGALVWFAPARGLGYDVDDAAALPDSTSYIRRDLMMLVKYGAAKVACETGGHPLGLGDMSDRDGATPGTAYGAPHHPRGTHEAGRDIDLGYYQRDTPDNRIRAICPHAIDGVEQWRCIDTPTSLDVRRTALFIGALFESPHVRIVGVDGQAGPPIQRALGRLCTSKHLPGDACARIKLGFENIDTGRNWFYGHHNHMHVSWKD